MSLANILSIARSALLTHRRAMALTAHNVANAATPGFSRQRLEIGVADPLRMPFGTVGRGVTVMGITRARDVFFDTSFRRESGFLGQSTTLTSFLSQVEASFNEPSDTGIAAALDKLFGAFGDLANNPISAPDRLIVQQTAISFVNQLHQLDAGIDQSIQDAAATMRAEVDEVNQISQQIATLNKAILAAGGTNGSAPDLEDQRDFLIDKLSTHMAVRVLQRPDGTIGVIAGETTLVDGPIAQQLEIRALAGGGYALGVVGSGGTIDAVTGSLKALTDLTNTKLPKIRSELDAYVRSVVTEFNNIHRVGFTLGGVTDTDFFDPAGVTAASIDLAAAIRINPDDIAAAATPAPGDGGVALLLADLSNMSVASLGGRTLREFYTGVAAGVGIQVEGARRDSEIRQALVDRSEIMRASVSGVSIEEEMILLIGQQEAYSAATRLIRVADEMMQELLRII